MFKYILSFIFTILNISFALALTPDQRILILSGNSCPASILAAPGTSCPSVDANFATGQVWVQGQGFLPLSSLLTNVNSTGGYVTNWDGSMTLVALNTLRVGTGTGLLVEESRTNLLLQSQNFGVTWANTASTVTANNITAPDGTLTGSTIAETNTTTAEIHQDVTTSANAAYVGSIFLKYIDTPWQTVYVYDQPNNVGLRMWVNIQTCTKGTVQALGASTNNTGFTPQWYGSWCGIALTTTPGGAGTAIRTQVNSAAADGSFTRVVGSRGQWGAQLNQASSPLSYTPTTTVAVTRAADQVTAAGTLLSVLQGSAFSVRANTYGIPSATGQPIILGFNSDTELYVNNLTSVQASIGGTFPAASISPGSFSTSVSSALGYSGSGASIVGNGSAATTSAGVFGSRTIATVGSGGPNRFINGYITRITAWASRLPDATLTRISDPLYSPALVTDFANGLYTYNGYNIGTAGLALLFSVSNSAGYCTDGSGNLVSYSANSLHICSGTGLLPEDTRTNVVAQTAFASGWTGTNTTATIGQIGPDGTTTAVLLVPTTLNGQHQYFNTTGLTLTAAGWTGAVYVKASGYGFASFLVASGATSGTRYSGVINLTTGAITTNGTQGSPTGTSSFGNCYSNGWCRITVTMTATADANKSFIGVMASSTGTPTYSAGLDPSFAGDGTSGILAWLPQLETGTFASSPIANPTNGTATRNFDNIQALGPVLNLLGVSGAGSMMAAWTGSPYYASASAPVVQHLAFWLDSTNTRWAYRAASASAGTPTFLVGDGAGITPLNVGSSYAAGTAMKSAFRWSNTSADMAMSVNQSAAATASRQFGSTLASPFYIGGSGVTGNGLNNPLGVMKFYPSGLSNNSLQSATQ